MKSCLYCKWMLLEESSKNLPGCCFCTATGIWNGWDFDKTNLTEVRKRLMIAETCKQYVFFLTER